MTGVPRRAFLTGLGASVLATGLAACSGSSGGPGPSGPIASPSGSAGSNSRYSGDLKLVAVAAALENLMISTYAAVMQQAADHRYGALPPAVSSFVAVAMDHHVAHAAAWNATLTHAGLPAVTGSPLTVSKSHLAAVRAATTVEGVTALALSLEDIAAQTYTAAVAALSDAGWIATSATIQPVEAMHAATLRFILGSAPASSSFIGTDDAMQPGALTA